MDLKAIVDVLVLWIQFSEIIYAKTIATAMSVWQKSIVCLKWKMWFDNYIYHTLKTVNVAQSQRFTRHILRWVNVSMDIQNQEYGSLVISIVCSEWWTESLQTCLKLQQNLHWKSHKNVNFHLLQASTSVKNFQV